MVEESADQSLKTLFASAENARGKVELATDTRSSQYHESLTNTIALYESCCQLADRLDLFSPNETLDDLATADVQYLLLDYRLGELLGRVSNRDRKQVLQQSQNAYERFLRRIDQYDIFGKNEKQLYESFLENPAGFSTVSTRDAGARRAEKISNFKKEKGLKQRLEYLSRNAASVDADDSSVRELYLANIQLCIHNTFQVLESIKLESEILLMAPAVGSTISESSGDDPRERDRPNESRSEGGYSDRVDLPISQLLSGSYGPILSQSGKPLRPFTLLDTRQRLQQGVFKPGHNLPTMTIDEYLEEERRRGGIIEGGGEASGIISDPDDGNFDKADEETMKARAWDEFVEENPRGSGNTLNRG